MRKLLFMMIIATSCYAGIIHAGAIHCAKTYRDKPFVEVTIASDMSGSGQAECEYKDSTDVALTAYHFPDENEYYPVSGYWRSAMPGTQWCSVQDGNSYDTCLFAKKVESA